ncbi:MAG: hypothetical protein JST28_14305 [Acidobacteria bacterium]|nr:hypothetical protein [Acidobacteriota bacterium]
MKVRSEMLKYGSFRRNSSFVCAGLKGPLVMALCAMLLIQPTLGTAQEPAKNPQAAPSLVSTAEFSSSQPAEELPSAPVPQAQPPAPPQQQNQPVPQDQASPQQSQPAQQPPVGTAAAPYEKPTGVPGSRPAGAAIAPAKQRRVRAIVISLGLIIAGGAAIGAIAGMSKASHSTP